MAFVSESAISLLRVLISFFRRAHPDRTQLLQQTLERARFRQMSGPMADNSSFEAIISRFHPDLFDDYDHWILGRLHQVTADLEKCLPTSISPLTHQIYAFFWGDFCDWYVEASRVN